MLRLSSPRPERTPPSSAPRHSPRRAESTLFAVNIKRSVGTGTVELTLDNGSTWQDITSQIGASYARIAVDQTLANPQVGIRIVTSGDAVIIGNTGVYYSTSKEVAAVSSPIKTTTAAVTRAADAIDYDDAAIIADNETRILTTPLSTGVQVPVDVDDYVSGTDITADEPLTLDQFTVYATGDRP